jgi:hypothetical protein
MLLSTQAIRLLLFSVEQSKAAYRAEGVLFAVVVLTAIVTFMFQPNNLLWSGARPGRTRVISMITSDRSADVDHPGSDPVD